MKPLIEYVRALNPVTERREVMSALAQLEEELNNYTLPIVKEVQEVFAGKSLKSPFVGQLTRELSKRIRFQGNPIDMVAGSLEQLQLNLRFLEAEAKRLFSVQFTRDNLTYKRMSFLRYVEAAHFYNQYTRKLLLRVVAEEALAVGSATPMSWAKAEKAWLDEGLVEYALLYPAIARKEADLKAALSSASDAVVDETTIDTAERSIGYAGLDPLNLRNFSPTKRNPFFSMGKALAEYKVKRYQNAKEEFYALQMRIQELREIQAEGRTDPKLQKLIQHTEQRIEQLDYKIAKIEEANRWD